jgi:acetolactate synthase-1/2/3 large subunit
VQIDLDYRTVGKNRDIDLGIVGDAGLVLKSVTEAASGRVNGGAAKRKEWLDELRAAEQTAIEKRLPSLKSDASPIHPYRLVSEINDFLTEDSIYIGDGGDIVTFSGQVVQPKSPGHWMDPGPLGTLGVGVPFVLAAKQARPDKEVVALFGDGAFSLTGWDFETLVRYDLPFVGIVGNNSSMSASGSATPSATSTTTSSRRCWAVTARRSATPPTSAPRCAAPASRASRR